MTTKFRGLLTLLLAFVVQLTFAQQKTISGTVTDDINLPLPGVNIIIKGTTSGTQSDFDGNYSISAEVGQTLVFSYVGFATQEVPITLATNTVNLRMEPDASRLEEVVIRGYSTISTRRSVISSQQLTSQTIENRPNTNAIQTLQGQVAGLNIASPTGQPGAPPNVLLRGYTSIGGENQPLFIIDGIPSSNTVFTSLNPQDIENVTVLKDAAATSIYGNRGANGVILVTTRTGKYNSSLEITYSGSTSISTLQNHNYSLLNSQELLRLEREFGNGLGTTLTDEEIDAYETFDWLDFFFREAIAQNHNLSLSSGGENISQNTSFGFNDTQGILKNTNLKRFNFRNNSTLRSNNDRFRVNTGISLNYTKENDPGSIGTGGINQNYVLGAIQSVPYITPDDYEGSEALLSPLLFRNTPLFLLDKLKTFDRIFEEFRGLGTLGFEYDILNDITLGSTTSIDYRHITNTAYQDPTSFNSLLFAPGGAANNPTPGFMDFGSNRQFIVNQLVSANWQKELDRHYIGVGLFTEYFKAHLRSFGFRQNGLDPNTWHPGDGGGFIPDNADNDWYVDTTFATSRDAGLFSYFGQLDYNFDYRYGFAATVRRDASFRFSETNRWGTFWSVAANWNVSEENFMSNADAINMLKLRFSYGTQGNQNITGGNFWSGANLFSTTWGSGSGYQGNNATFLSSIGNDALRWEKVTSSNLGVDFGFFNNRLRGAIDVYKKTTDDLFIDGPTSLTTGISALRQNLGTMENRGIELLLQYDVIRPRNEGGFGMNFTFTGSYNKNELVDLGLDREEIIGIGRVGGPIFEIYAVPFVGVNPENGNLLFLDIDGNETETPDQEVDRRWTGKNRLPDYQGSFSFNFDYKNFFLQTQFNYVIGVHRTDADLASLYNVAAIGDFRLSTDVLDYWTPDNTDATFPALNATNSGTASDRFVRNADFLRLRFLSFGYGFSNNQLRGTGLNKLRVFANAENLVTFTKWDGFDPEQLFIPGLNTTADIGEGRRYPTPRTISIGLEIGF
jgi:TonB-linked SusC/RagA family outer membrane protein